MKKLTKKNKNQQLIQCQVKSEVLNENFYIILSIIGNTVKIPYTSIRGFCVSQYLEKWGKSVSNLCAQVIFWQLKKFPIAYMYNTSPNFIYYFCDVHVHE